jgi:hypothetical protein
MFLNRMFSFGNKPLDNLLGAAYLTGALEAMKKSKQLGLDESEDFFDETKRVRRVLISRAESDGYDKPVNQIEEAKKIAKNVLNSPTSTNKKNSNVKTTNSSNTIDSVGMAPMAATDSPITNSTNVSPPTNVTAPTSVTTPTTMTTLTSATPSTLSSDELMPLKNSITLPEMKKPNIPPPVLQLGGKRRRKTKKHKRRSNK